LGSPRVPVQGNLTELLSEIHMRWITFRGALEWCFPTYSELPNVQTLYAKQETIFNWIREGKLAIEPLVSHHFQPVDIKTAYDSLLQQPDIFTGVVLDWK
jgi:threonine dehydrogenase-like Zn-dependent dehydrogenase